MITLPQGTDTTGLFIGLLCSIGFVMLFILFGLLAEKSSRLLSNLMLVPAFLGLVATIVLILVAGATNQTNFDARITAITKQLDQQYGVTVPSSQASALYRGHQITLNDGTHVRLRFSDHRRHATLVSVAEAPYPQETR
jgi:hypothetical protein